MSKIEVDTIAPQSGTTVTVGESGDTVTIPTGVTLDASNATTTLPANVVTTDGTQTLTNKSIAATQLTGTVATSNLGTGTADATTFLRGDQTYASATPAAGSITTTQLAYNPNSFRNIIINGDMNIAQRGTSTTGVTTSDGYYACDRWYSQTDIGTWTISQSTDVPTGQGFVNSFKMDCTSAGTGNADEVMIRQKFEGQNLQYLKYETANAESLTLSFWIKSNKIGNYYLAMANTNTTQNRVVSFGYSIDSADTWEKKTITIPGDTSQGFDNSNVENFTLFWLFSAASGFTSGGVSNTWINYAANRFANSDLAGLGGSTSDYVNVTGVQLEAGTSASDFEFLPYDVNLQRCQRYYYLHARGAGQQIGNGSFYNSSDARCVIFFPTTMRSQPSIVSSNNTNDFRFLANGTSYYSPSVETPGGTNQFTMEAIYTPSLTGSPTGGHAFYLVCGNSTSLLAFNSEL